MRAVLSFVLISVLLPGCADADENDRAKREAEQRKLFIDCFPEKARPLFDKPISPLQAEREAAILGRQLADAIGDGETLALAVCRALGTLSGQESNWSRMSSKEYLVLAGARTVEDQQLLKALNRLKGDRQGLQGAARLFFLEKFSQKLPEAVRADWGVRLAEVVLNDGWDGNKSLVLSTLGNDQSTQARDLLRDVFAGKVGKEIDYSSAWSDEPGIRAGAALALAARGDATIQGEIKNRVESAHSKNDIAAYAICLALFGDPKQIKTEHFRLRSYDIGLAGLVAIERFKGQHGMEALVRGAIHHPWGHVRDEALKTFTRLTGEKMSPGEIEDWYEEKYEGKRRTESLVTFGGNKHQLRSVAFSPDGKRIVAGSNDSTAIVWDIVGGKKLILEGHTYTVIGAVFSPDSKFIATASGDHTVRIWNSMTGANTHVLKGHTNWVKSVAYSPDGKLLVSGGQDGMAIVWDALTGERKATFRGKGDYRVDGVMFSPDGKAIASCDGAQTTRIWDALTANEQLSVHCGKNGRMTGVAFSPDGMKIAISCGEDRTVRVFSATSGETLLTLTGHSDWVSSVAYAPDGKTIASTGWDKTVRLWDAQTGKQLLSYKAHPEWINRVAFSPDGTQLATASEDKTARIWEISKLLAGVTDKK